MKKKKKGKKIVEQRIQQFKRESTFIRYFDHPRCFNYLNFRHFIQKIITTLEREMLNACNVIIPVYSTLFFSVSCKQPSHLVSHLQVAATFPSYFLFIHPVFKASYSLTAFL